jgi:hypothetical protein
MFRGYWSCIFAFVGWLALCGAQPPIKQPQNTSSTQQPAPKPRSAAITTPIITAEPFTKFTAYPDYCYQAKDHDAADLCAQWRSTLAAEKAAEEAGRSTTWSIFATILNVLSLVAVVIALFLTRQANGISRKMFEADTKPFLMIKPTSKDIEFRNGKLQPAPIEFAIENVGRGPAIVTAIYREWTNQPRKTHPEPIEFGKKRDGRKRKKIHLVIGSGAESQPLDSLSANVTGELPDDGWISFLGYIEFTDLQGQKYAAGFLYIFRLDLPARGLHLALPEDRADKYNYHCELPKSVQPRSWPVPV